MFWYEWPDPGPLSRYLPRLFFWVSLSEFEPPVSVVFLVFWMFVCQCFLLNFSFPLYRFIFRRKLVVLYCIVLYCQIWNTLVWCDTATSMESMYWLRRMCATGFSVLRQQFWPKTDLRQQMYTILLVGMYQCTNLALVLRRCASKIGSLRQINRYFTAWIPHWLVEDIFVANKTENHLDVRNERIRTYPVSR